MKRQTSGGTPPPSDEPTCPGPDCLACNGEACDLCGAGCWNNDPDRPRCEHDVVQRHQLPVSALCSPAAAPMVAGMMAGRGTT